MSSTKATSDLVLSTGGKTKGLVPFIARGSWVLWGAHAETSSVLECPMAPRPVGGKDTGQEDTLSGDTDPVNSFRQSHRSSGAQVAHQNPSALGQNGQNL